MPLTFATFTGRGVTTNVATYVAVAQSLAANHLILAWVSNSKASAPDDPASIVGHGLTWTKITSKNAGSLNKVSVWRAMSSGTTPTSERATINFAAAQTGCAYGFLSIAGVPLSSDGSSAIVQYASNSFGTGVTTSTTTISALSKPSNAVVCGLTFGYNANPTKETAYTAAATHPGYNTPASRLGVSWLDAANTEVTPSWSWTGACAPGAIALELVAYGTNRNATTFIGTTNFFGASDSFDRADAGLPAPWTNAGFASEGLKTVSNQCQKVSPTTTTDSAMHYTGGQCAASVSEQYSKFTWIAGADLGVLLRSTATQTYQGNFTSNVCAIHQWTSAGGWSFNVVTAIPCVLASGDNVSFQVTGTTGAATFSLFLNGSNVGTRVYSATPLVNGYPGISMYQGDTPIVDNWAGGPIEKNGLNWWSQLAAAVGGAIQRTIPTIISLADAISNSRWLIRASSIVRPATHLVSRLSTVLRNISSIEAIQAAVGRTIVFIRTIPVVGTLLSSVSRSIALSVRSVSASLTNAFSVSRLRWAIRNVPLSLARVFSASRLGTYLKRVSSVNYLSDVVGRVAVFVRTIAVSRALLSTVSRAVSLWVRTISASRGATYVVGRIGEFIRSVNSAVEWAIAVGRSVSGQLTLRTIEMYRATSTSASRLANYFKTVALSRVISSSVSRVMTRIRTIPVIRGATHSISRLTERIRTATISRSLGSTVRWLAWYIRRINFDRPVSTLVSRISQMGRRVSHSINTSFGLVWAIAGALTTRTVSTVRAISDSVVRNASFIRALTSTKLGAFSVNYGRWLIRYVERLGVGVSSAGRSASYIRNIVSDMRNNFVVTRLITAVLRIWNAITSSYRNLLASASSEKSTTIVSDSKKQQEVSLSSAKLSEFTTSSRQKEKVP